MTEKLDETVDINYALLVGTGRNKRGVDLGDGFWLYCVGRKEGRRVGWVMKEDMKVEERE